MIHNARKPKKIWLSKEILGVYMTIVTNSPKPFYYRRINQSKILRVGPIRLSWNTA